MVARFSMYKFQIDLIIQNTKLQQKPGDLCHHMKTINIFWISCHSISPSHFSSVQKKADISNWCERSQTIPSNALSKISQQMGRGWNPHTPCKCKEQCQKKSHSVWYPGLKLVLSDTLSSRTQDSAVILLSPTEHKHCGGGTSDHWQDVFYVIQKLTNQVCDQDTQS